MSEQEVQFIRAPNTLRKAKSGKGPGKLDPQLLARAEKAVVEMEQEYARWAGEDINLMESIIENIKQSRGKDQGLIRDLYRHAFDMKGQGGSFGYQMVTQIAGSLTDFLESRSILKAIDMEACTAHVSAMRAVFAQDVRDDGGPTGIALLDGLKQLVAKAEAKG
jgi:chemotaxis protein histidine kinase CheA